MAPFHFPAASRANTERLAVAAAAAAAVLALAGCVDEQPQPAEPETVQAPAQAWDTGDFRTTPLNIANLEADANGLTEAMGYGDHVPIPYEVDPSFDRGGGAQVHLGPGTLILNLGEDKVAALETAGADFAGGYVVAAADQDGRDVSHTIIRLGSPESAASAAAEFVRIDRADTTLDPGTGEPVAAQPEEVPGHPGVSATRIGDELRAVAVQGEFLVLAWAAEPLRSEARSSEELRWQGEYVARYLDRQLPMIAGIPTLVRDSGVGNSPEGIPADPQDVLRYTVLRREQDMGIYPANVAPRQFAARYEDPRGITELMGRAGVDVVALDRVSALRARDEDAARRLLEEWVEYDVARDHRVYDEEQGLPGTRCVSRDEESGVSYSCAMQYGRYVAVAGLTDRFSTPEDDDAKREVSQMMAAQYELFEQRP